MSMKSEKAIFQQLPEGVLQRADKVLSKTEAKRLLIAFQAVQH